MQTEVGAKPVYHSWFDGRHESRINVQQSPQREYVSHRRAEATYDEFSVCDSSKRSRRASQTVR